MRRRGKGLQSPRQGPRHEGPWICRIWSSNFFWKCHWRTINRTVAGFRKGLISAKQPFCDLHLFIHICIYEYRSIYHLSIYPSSSSTYLIIYVNEAKYEVDSSCSSLDCWHLDSTKYLRFKAARALSGLGKGLNLEVSWFWVCIDVDLSWIPRLSLTGLWPRTNHLISFTLLISKMGIIVPTWKVPVWIKWDHAVIYSVEWLLHVKCSINICHYFMGMNFRPMNFK